MKWIKKHIVLLTLIIIAIMSVITDIIFESNITIFNEVNKDVNFSTVVKVCNFFGLSLSEFFDDDIFNLENLDFE